MSSLARRNAGLSVVFLVLPSARRVGVQFVQLFVRYQDQYMAVEVTGLRDRSA